ncbi:hypothetical protein JDV02_001411 [Purpureocillium takamizusanense]|uniref:Transcription factor domain-containing protein n=1 Tax=Purpureocillium takamizusanense TaxID=2060973 RepID=A0A9Q8Q947_9HYPO|nr:uncharacterized protein JDV02_001411 [Purpureocillium takamizusanense]UNI14819.1 hypothetical protein JDV02_001411 [Purpureocillium takamizusanense]
MGKSAEWRTLDYSKRAGDSQGVDDVFSRAASGLDGRPTSTSDGEPSQRLHLHEGSPSTTFLTWSALGEFRPVLPLSRWTAVTRDEGVLNHLFALFWTWDHSLARILHRELLLDSLTADPEAPGHIDTCFCSQFLINSILAISTSCFYKSDGPSMFALRGSSFADEAFQLLAIQQEPIEVSLMQGVAILSVHEMTFGDLPLGTSLFFDKLSALKSSSTVLDGPGWLGYDRGNPKASKVEQAMASIANGFHCLDVRMSLIANRPATALGLSGTPPPQEEGVSPLWTPYPVAAEPQLSYHSQVSAAEYELTQMACEFLPAIEESRSSVVPDYCSSKELYDRFLAWKSSSPDMLRCQTIQAPSWTNLRVWFELVCLKLLEPFLGLSFSGFDGVESARSLSRSHCENLISHLWNYRASFGMRLECWLVYACHASVASLLTNLPLPGPHEDLLCRGCELLFEMGHYMPRANDLLLALQDEASLRNIEIPNACKPYLDAGAALARRINIRNVTPLLFTPANEGLELQSCQVTFGSHIEGLEEDQNQRD